MNIYLQTLYEEANLNNYENNYKKITSKESDSIYENNNMEIYSKESNTIYKNSDIEIISKDGHSIYCHKFILNSSEFFKTYIESEFYNKQFEVDFSFNALSFMIGQLYLINKKEISMELEEKIECFILRDMMKSKYVKLIVPMIECEYLDDLIILVKHTVYDEIKIIVDDYLKTNALNLIEIKKIAKYIVGYDVIICELYDDEELKALHYEYAIRFTYMYKENGKLLSNDDICKNINICMELFEHYKNIKTKQWYKKKYDNFYKLEIDYENVRELLDYYDIIKKELNVYFEKSYISVNDMFLLSKNKFEHIKINLEDPIIHNKDVFIEFVKTHKISLNVRITCSKGLDFICDFNSIIDSIILKDCDIDNSIFNKKNKIRMITIDGCKFSKTEVIIKSKYLQILNITWTNLEKISLKTPNIITLELYNNNIKNFKDITISNKYKQKLLYVKLSSIKDNYYNDLIKFNHCEKLELDNCVVHFKNGMLVDCNGDPYSNEEDVTIKSKILHSKTENSNETVSQYIDSYSDSYSDSD